ncbi:MAG TPA: type II toxin-antitoxin system HicB family antitoxin [Gemmataceae bacterium]|nr:type II toxin-antitoxin system HicB family antitoxin [Gemmataceae bacterium]
MEYKGYIGRVEFDDDARIFHGEVINTRDVITFQGSSVDELLKAFSDSVDDYLAFCKERGEDPDKPFSGQFVTRISPELHRKIHYAATLSGKSLNGWVQEQLQIAAMSSLQNPKPKQANPSRGTKRAQRGRRGQGHGRVETRAKSKATSSPTEGVLS